MTTTGQTLSQAHTCEGGLQPAVVCLQPLRRSAQLTQELLQVQGPNMEGVLSLKMA